MNTNDSHEAVTFHSLGGIGDVNSQARGTGARFNAGKPDYSLMPFWCLDGVAQVWTYGHKKYAAFDRLSLDLAMYQGKAV